MNRRALLLTGAVSALSTPSYAQEGTQADTLLRLINEVIGDRYMRNLDQLVTSDVVVRSMGINGIAEFRQASEDGRTSKSENFSEISLLVVSVAEDGRWAHALVQYGGETKDGTPKKGYLFYAAYFTGGLVSHLYIG